MVHPASQTSRLVALLAFVATSLGLATTAEARLETVRWTHPRSDASDFQVRIRTLSTSSSQIVSLGVSGQPVGSGYTADVEVGEGDVELEMRAVGPGGELSSWNTAVLRRAPTAPAPAPAPAPTPAPSPEVDPGAGTTIPPTVGAAERLDFSGNAPGTSVAGWVDTTANYGLSVDDGLFSVVSVGGNRMLSTESTQNAIHSTATGTVRNNFEVRGRMAIDHPDGEIGVTTYSAYPTQDVHYRISREAGETFRFASRPGIVCASSDSGVSPAEGQWIRFELDVRDEGDQNRIVAKIWPAGQSEPASPQIDCVDSSAGRPTQGAIGVWSGGLGSKFWDDFETFQGVTGGGAASAPLPPLLIQIIPFEN